MVKAKYSAANIKIQISIEGKLIFFARIKRNLWESLETALQGSEYSDRTKWIKSQYATEFGYELNTKEDLNRFDEFLDKNNYEDKSDWLRDKIRDYLKAQVQKVGKGI